MESPAALAIARGCRGKEGLSAWRVFKETQEDRVRSCHSTFKVCVLQFLVALEFDSKLGLTVVLVFFPQF